LAEEFEAEHEDPLKSASTIRALSEEEDTSGWYKQALAYVSYNLDAVMKYEATKGRELATKFKNVYPLNTARTSLEILLQSRKGTGSSSNEEVEGAACWAGTHVKLMNDARDLRDKEQKEMERDKWSQMKVLSAVFLDDKVVQERERERESIKEKEKQKKIQEEKEKERKELAKIQKRKAKKDTKSKKKEDTKEGVDEKLVEGEEDSKGKEVDPYMIQGVKIDISLLMEEMDEDERENASFDLLDDDIVLQVIKFIMKNIKIFVGFQIS